MNDLFILIMAGGLGKRMNSDIPKVLHLINNEPMIVKIIKTANRLNPKKIIIVVGKFKEIIKNKISEYIDLTNIEFIDQDEPLGTGHAIMCCSKYLSNYLNSKTLILSGDVPLITENTLNKIINNSKNVTIATSKVDNPYGYGRIVLNNNIFEKIVEEKDCNDLEKDIKIINSGIYIFNTEILIKNINFINNINKQNEYYLTDIFSIIKNKNINIDLYNIECYNEILGVNTSEQLNYLNKIII